MCPPLVPLPEQPADIPWPTDHWDEAAPGAEVDHAQLQKISDELFAEPVSASTGETRALAIVHRGQLVFERYAPDVDRDKPLVSWSMAKSITHALVGILVGGGRLDIHLPGLVPAWSGPNDPRAAITVDHMLRMVDGLDFTEDYLNDQISSVIEMLFGSGKADVVGYTEARRLRHAPDTVWNYSSGTTNIVAALVARVVGGGQAEMEAFMRRELFDRIGMKSAAPRFDPAGHFIGSSFVWATARDFARFGLLVLRDGCWEGERILPPGWVDYARTPTPVSRGEYGAHWWLALDGSAVFHASGYHGQFIVIDPSRDLVLVRLADSTPDQRGNVYRQLRGLIHSFPERARSWES